MPEQVQLENKMTETLPPRLWMQTILFSSTLLIALIGVPWYGITHGFTWTGWLGFFLILGANGMSITAGYHRLWAHNSYKAHPILKVMFALFGAAATQNSILIWASGHRRHHRHVDHVEQDPYSAKKACGTLILAGCCVTTPQAARTSLTPKTCNAIKLSCGNIATICR